MDEAGYLLVEATRGLELLVESKDWRDRSEYLVTEMTNGYPATAGTREA